MELYRYFPGSAPLLISVPHAGTHVPDGIRARLTPRRRRCRIPTGMSTGSTISRARWARTCSSPPIRATWSTSIAGRTTHRSIPAASPRGWCRERASTRRRFYRDGEAPGADETAERLSLYWQPYHDKLREVLASWRSVAPRAGLFDAHSIRGEIRRCSRAGWRTSISAPAAVSPPRRNWRPRWSASLLQVASALCSTALQGRLHHPPLRRAGGRYQRRAARARAA